MKSAVAALAADPSRGEGRDRVLRLALLDRYVLRRLAPPLAATVAIALALLLLERMLRLFDFVVNQNGPVDVVWRMLLHLVPHYLGMALPVGFLVAALIVVRNLSLSSELDALQAGGVGLPRIMRPLMLVAVALGLADLAIVGWQEPVSRYAYRQLEFELRSGALGASIRLGAFSPLGEGLTLRVGEAGADGRALRDLFVRRMLANGREMSITAREGRFVGTEDEQKIILRLQDGVMLDFDPRHARPRVMEFALQDLLVDLPQIEPFRRRGGEELEMTLDELWTAMRDPATPPDRRAHYRGAFHWRVVHLFTALVLPLLAVAFGTVRKRGSGAGGLVLATALLIVYNELEEAATRAVQAGGDPWLTQWALFAGFAGLAGFFFWSVAFHPGRGALGRLDRVADRLGRMAKWAMGRMTGHG